jgi:hypothetical protein
MNTLGHPLEIECFEFGNIFDRQLVASNYMFDGEVKLVETADNGDTFAQVLPVRVWKNAGEEKRCQSDDVQQVLPRLIPARNLFSGVARWPIKRTGEIRSSIGNRLAMCFPDFIN